MPPNMPPGGILFDLGQGNFFKFQEFDMSTTKEDHDLPLKLQLAQQLLTQNILETDPFQETCFLDEIQFDHPSEETAQNTVIQVAHPINGAQFGNNPELLVVMGEIRNMVQNVKRAYFIIELQTDNDAIIKIRIPSPTNPNQATFPVALDRFVELYSTYSKFVLAEAIKTRIEMTARNERMARLRLNRATRTIARPTAAQSALYQDAPGRFFLRTVLGRRIWLFYTPNNEYDVVRRARLHIARRAGRILNDSDSGNDLSSDI